MNKLPKPKRGAAFYHIELKQTVWLERIQSSTRFFVKLKEEPASIDDYATVTVSELKSVNKPGQPIRTVVKPVSAEERQRRADLKVFFASQTLTMPGLCENCGAPLILSNALFRKAQVAHILPKKDNDFGFPEVACHPQNRMFLGVQNCSCHDRWDKGTALERAAMNCYPLALERFELFKADIKLKNMIRAFTYLNISWQ